MNECLIDRDDLVADLGIMLSTAKSRDYSPEIIRTIESVIRIVKQKPYYRNNSKVVLYRYKEGFRDV